MAPGTPSNRAEAALNPEITAPWIDFQQPLTALFAEIEALRRETAAVGEEIAAGVEDLRAEQAKYAQLQKEFSCRLQTSEEVDVKLRDDLRAFCERRSPAAIKIPGSAERVAHLRHLSRSLKQNLSDESLNEEVSPTLWQRLTRIRHPEERPRRLLHALLAIVLVAQFAEGTLMFITCYPSTASGALYLICFALASLLSTIEMYLNFYTTTFVGWELLDSPEDLPAIKSKYFRGWFAFDFITAFPWDLLALAFGRSKFGSVQCLKPFSPEHFYSWVHWLRVVQVIRVPTFFKTSNPLAETSRYINVVWGCFILYTALHSLAFLYLLTSNEKEHQFDPNAPTAIKYIAALTWAIQTPVHGIYFVPLQPVTRFLDIVIVVLGLTSVLILSALLAAFVVSRGPFGEERRERGRRLETVIRLAEVPQNVHKSVSSIYPSLSQLHEQDYGAVLHTLPPFLVDEVRNCMKEKYIKRIPMFMDGGPCACSVLAWASDALTVPAQSAIIEDGRAPDALYVLGYGVAELTVINTITGKPDVIANLRSGAWFGDRALVHQATTLASVRSVTTCDLFRLVQDDFSVVCEEFPELSESISRHFREHLTKLAEYTISTTKVRTFETNVGHNPRIAAPATNPAEIC
eukprot:TRINITY_DN287_c0_g3_i1.p1 TRINITY_DN287_c0_g3~~TRINITY_DN287_c0_g3_i1.p1  ORF type:complete len:632 (-),score=106.46 TRINITY_DN287_c0_g3_i1:3802-5697(-)